MIKNERQYRITRTKVDDFKKALESDEDAGYPEGMHPRFIQAYKEALRSQLDELVSQLRAYELLQEGKQVVLELQTFDEIPRALIQARIAAGMTQKDLAEKLNLKPQQIQRYESDGYSSASLERIKEVMSALGLELQEDILLPSSNISVNDVFERLGRLGYPKSFVLNRLLPSPLSAEIELSEEGKGSVNGNLALRTASTVSRVFGWKPAAFLGPRLPSLNPAIVATAKFKASTSAEEKQLSAYTVYAHILALLVLEATKHLEQKPVPTDPLELRQIILKRSVRVNFENALRLVWDLGIPVLPLNDPGAFHGACWRVGGRNVIVIKQLNQSAARWLYDLLHELRHTTEAQQDEEWALVETSPISPDRVESEEEEEANYYAEDVMFGGKSDKLEQLCINTAGRSMERLKQAVVDVAHREGVEVDALANHMAWRLSQQGQDWWGAASNLQRSDFSPWSYARDVLLSKIDLGQLNEFDRTLLLRALSNNNDE